MPLKVLVIDPNAAASTLVHDTLQREGYEVATANSLEEGLAAFRDAAADLVLLSSEADPDGLEGWWAREGDTLGQVPLLLIGGGAEGVVPAAGTVDTPIDADDLIGKVRDQLGPPEAAGNLAWLPDALKEASDEIAEMERLLGWSSTPVEKGAVEADPVSLGIFTEEEMQAAAGAEAAAPEVQDEDDETAEEADEAPERSRATGTRAKRGPGTEAAAEPVREPLGPVAGLPPEQVEQIVADLARQAVERVVWETVPAMVARFISQNRAEQDALFTRIVERVVWETVPEIAEAQVKAEIRRISEGDG
jgi:hypothetical protein